VGLFQQYFRSNKLSSMSQSEKIVEIINNLYGQQAINYPKHKQFLNINPLSLRIHTVY
jgi:hypothetical protein